MALTLSRDRLYGRVQSLPPTMTRGSSGACSLAAMEWLIHS